MRLRLLRRWKKPAAPAPAPVPVHSRALRLDNPYGRVYTPHPPACPACAAGRKTQSKHTLCPQTADRAFFVGHFPVF